MARTTDAEVRSIITTDAAISTAQFITNANVLTDRVSARAVEKGVTLTAAELLLIETYLAAHFYALRDPQEERTKTGRASSKFQTSKKGNGLEATDWGQQALAFDYSGALAQIVSSSEGGVVEAEWLGTERT